MTKFYKKPRGEAPLGFYFYNVLLAEVPLQQALESLAVAGFVTNVTKKPSNINTFFKNPTWLDTIFVL